MLLWSALVVKVHRAAQGQPSYP